MFHIPVGFGNTLVDQRSTCRSGTERPASGGSNFTATGRESEAQVRTTVCLVNPNGGAISLFNPLCMSGAHITAPRRSSFAGAGALAIATISIGVGQGIAIALECTASADP